MGFYDVIKSYEDFEFASFFNGVSREDVLKVLDREKLSEMDLLTLLSPAASQCLEDMAQIANFITIQNFGKVVLLYTPLYLADFCLNECIYCSFNVANDFKRSMLSMAQLEAEAKKISATGLKHILILTGESRVHTPVSYIGECTSLLAKFFTSVSIEVYPMDVHEYQKLINDGVDGLTIYQEVYDEAVYDRLHLSGPKKNYHYRLDAPERGCLAGIRTVNIGALLGLNDFRRETFFTGLHAHYLQKRFWDAEVGVSLPRIRPHLGEYTPSSIVDDKSFVQLLLALRIFLPRSGISISTRENPIFRENLLALGVTRMSAGVSTQVGGHTLEEVGKSQFDISDCRSVKEIRDMAVRRGYQPIFVDWR